MAPTNMGSAERPVPTASEYAASLVLDDLEWHASRIVAGKSLLDLEDQLAIFIERYNRETR